MKKVLKILIAKIYFESWFEREKFEIRTSRKYNSYLLQFGIETQFRKIEKIVQFRNICEKSFLKRERRKL